MSLGLCCHFVEEITHRNGKKTIHNIFDAKTLQLGRFERSEYSEDRIRSTYLHNFRSILTTLPKVVKAGIRHYRMSSDCLPLSDKVPREYWDNTELRNLLKQIGDFTRHERMRISVHPGQYCVLNSTRDSVIQKSVWELVQHAWIFDACGFDRSPHYAINIHAGVGGRISNLIDTIKTLSHGIRSRLTLENCESVGNVEELVAVSQSTGVPVVFDSHHHVFNPGSLTMQQAFDAAARTWPSYIKPLQHVANTEPGLENSSFSQRRKHSNYINYIPECQLEALKANTIDVEVEAKLKNLSLIALQNKFGLKFA